MHDAVIAIDVGGTQIKAGLVDRRLSDLVTVRRDTRRLGAGPAAVDQLADLVAELAGLAGTRSLALHAVGVAVPGIVDEPAGLARLATNLGWHDLPVGPLLAGQTTLPTAIGHDVRAGGLAEFTVGAGRGVANALFVPIGTGIAAAIRIDGGEVRADGYAGELGHLVIDPAGEACACGGIGCLETIASATAVARRYRERSGRPVISAAEVAQRVLDGDPDACSVWAEAVEALASALAMAVTLFAPEVIVLGGGLAESGDILLHPVRVALDRRLSFQRRPALVPAELGAQAGQVGAALLAWQAVAE